MLLASCQPTLELSGGRERKPVPEAGGAGARIRAPGRGCPARRREPTIVALSSGNRARPWEG